MKGKFSSSISAPGWRPFRSSQSRWGFRRFQSLTGLVFHGYLWLLMVMVIDGYWWFFMVFHSPAPSRSTAKMTTAGRATAVCSSCLGVCLCISFIDFIFWALNKMHRTSPYFPWIPSPSKQGIPSLWSQISPWIPKPWFPDISAECFIWLGGRDYFPTTFEDLRATIRWLEYLDHGSSEAPPPWGKAMRRVVMPKRSARKSDAWAARTAQQRFQLLWPFPDVSHVQESPGGVYWVLKSLGIPIIAVNLLDLPSPDGLLGVSIASGLVHVGSPRHCPTEFTGVRTGWPMASWWATRRYSNPWGRSWRRRLQHLGVGHGPRFDGWLWIPCGHETWLENPPTTFDCRRVFVG